MKYRLDQTTTEEIIKHVADRLMIAAKTAPKGRGVNCLDMILLTGKDKDDLSVAMDKIAKEESVQFFYRDADNIRQSQAVLLIACHSQVRGLNCGLCGSLCDTKPEAVPCVFNVVDLGIALGSAVSTAMDLKVDNRIMYSAGKAAVKLKLFAENMPIAFAIPLSIDDKNIFFDRK